MHRLSLSIALVLATTLPAHADAADPVVAITTSPIHLALPLLELTAEFKLAPKLAVAATVGVGATRIEDTDEKVNLLEAGVSPRYYVWGTFRHGVQLGAEIQYLHASANSDASEAEVRASGLSIGPYVGYKWTARFGLTLEAQLGVAYLALHGEEDGTTTIEEDSDIIPLLNLNIGWSF